MGMEPKQETGIAKHVQDNGVPEWMGRQNIQTKAQATVYRKDDQRKAIPVKHIQKTCKTILNI